MLKTVAARGAIGRRCLGLLQAAPLGKAETETSMVGQIYLARVERVVERLQAAFIDMVLTKALFGRARSPRFAARCDARHAD